MPRCTAALALLGLVACFPAHAQFPSFLDQKTVFCYSEQSLASYLNFAKQKNMEGLNLLVLAGKCNFVPDEQTYQIENYQVNFIGKTPIISFNRENKTLWTFKRLVTVASDQP